MTAKRQGTQADRRQERRAVRDHCHGFIERRLLALAEVLVRIDRLVPKLRTDQTVSLVVACEAALEHLSGVEVGLKVALGLPLDGADGPDAPPPEPAAPAPAAPATTCTSTTPPTTPPCPTTSTASASATAAAAAAGRV